MEEEELEKIKNDYIKRKKELEQIAVQHLNMLNVLPGVHAFKYRVKNEERLIEKIRRKINEGKNITFDNYLKKITDLIGIRILHIFKDEWKEIDNYIRKTYTLKEKPKAYIRAGDSKNGIQNYGFKTEEHKFGYRSLHYLIKTKPNKNEYIIEIQVRTIFEEAWGEIDHSIRYPNISDYEILNEYSLILNRLAGLGDEMGLNIKNIKLTMDINKKEIEKKDAKILKSIEERDIIIKHLLEKVNISNEEIQKYRKKLKVTENTIKEEQEKISNIKNNLVKPYYLAKDIISQIDKSKITIDPHDWDRPLRIAARHLSIQPIIKDVKLFFIDPFSVVILELIFYDGEYYISSSNSSLNKLVRDCIINLESIDVKYLDIAVPYYVYRNKPFVYAFPHT